MVEELLVNCLVTASREIKGSSELWKSNERLMFNSLNKLETKITKISDKYNGMILKSIGLNLYGKLPHPKNLDLDYMV